MRKGFIFGVAVAAACGNDGDATDASASTDTFATASATAAETTDQGDAESDDDGAATGDSSTGAGDDDGSAESSSSEGGIVCDQQDLVVQLEPQTPQVMLVLDKSRSMSNLWDHDNDPATAEISRYHSLHNVVSFLVTEFADRIEFGAQLFPAAEAWLDEPTNEFSCLVHEQPEVGVAPGMDEEILAMMPPADDFSISGGTPAAKGLQSAIEQLTALPGDAPKAILLVTDGAANCNPDEAPEDTLFVYDADVPLVVADALASHQIPTYVVGINILDELGDKPLVNPYSALSEVAQQGGVPSAGPDAFYNSFNEIELEAALDVVANKIGCSFTLELEPQFPEHVTVEILGKAYPEVADCAMGDGWAWTSPNGPYTTIELCGVACDDLQDSPTVDVHYGCP
jgi:hypothetical protein